MIFKNISFFLLGAMLSINLQARSDEEIPLPEHPRPDFCRPMWQNLNGTWDFCFDGDNIGETENWFTGVHEFDKKIMVPFPWGSKLSGVGNEADIAWYSRKITVPEEWKGRRVFVIFGASDWKTTVWLDGKKLGSYQGGYTPFEFDLSSLLKPGKEQLLVVRVDDSPHDFKLYGKQGYGDAKGLWQTVYLEARGDQFLKTVHVTPNIDRSAYNLKIVLDRPAQKNYKLKISLKNDTFSNPELLKTIKKGEAGVIFEIPLKNMHLWDIDDPFLYELKLELLEGENRMDELESYFGMRKIGVKEIPGYGYPYLSLNNRPLYLKMTLDQSYHPDGFYTFPDDDFMRDEILRSKRIGLNCNRIHIKVEIPRKLYWADKLGLLIMADVPNSWGEPDSLQQAEWETAMRGMIERDYNHPSVFSWVLFNETWGLFTKLPGEERRQYLPATQNMVEKMYYLAKELDPSRLVEDNSACNYDHVKTDLNSWHAYLPGYRWKEFLDDAVRNTYEGSTWNYIGGYKQGDEPMLNSECGNVWGYEGSTGDVDWSWDYHIMMNELRLHPRVCGWLYTEHHDVINEWNGYYKYDRSEKYTGLEKLVPGMGINDFHSDLYVASQGELCRKAIPGEKLNISLTASFMTSRDYGKKVYLSTELVGWDRMGQFHAYSEADYELDYKPWDFEELINLPVTMPEREGLNLLRFVLSDAAGNELHHNFMCFLVEAPEQNSSKIILTDNGQKARLLSFKPSSFISSGWSGKQWEVLEGLKVNGSGYGYFEYEVTVPEDINLDEVQNISLILEASSKQLFGKDMEMNESIEGDYMRGKGTFDNSRNPNSYPMTDNQRYPGMFSVRVNGKKLQTFYPEDDPADHQGILSWFSQPRNNRLNEAGSYGYLFKTAVPVSLVNVKTRKITLRLEVDKAMPNGLAIYGKDFGRYPLDPSLVFILK